MMQKPGSLRQIFQKFGAFLDPALVFADVLCLLSCFCWILGLSIFIFSDIQGRTSMFVASSLVSLFRHRVFGGEHGGVVRGVP